MTVTIPLPAGPPTNLGARIEVPVTRDVVSARQAAVLVPRLVGAYDEQRTLMEVTAVLASPEAAGEYLVAWVSDDGYSAFQPLTVTAS